MPGQHDYIPKNDEVLKDFAQNILQYATKHYQRWKVPAPAEFLETPLGDFAGALSLFRATNHGDIDTKNKMDTKKVLVKALRNYIQGFIAKNPLVTNEDKRLMRLPIRDPKPSPKPVPDKKPILLMSPSGRGRHTATVINPDTNDRTKPSGVAGVVIGSRVRKATDPVSKAGDMGSDFQASTIRHYQYGEDQYELVVDYAAAYENDSGDRGPWSDVVTVTIAG